MSDISVTTEYSTGFTLVPDAFIDNILPSSNGEYIKVYLYMLKALRCGGSVDTSEIADALEKEEADIVRALKYWEKKGVFELQVENKTVSHICIKKLEGGDDFDPVCKDGGASSTHLRSCNLPDSAHDKKVGVIPEISQDLKKTAFKSSHTLPGRQDSTELPEDVILLITAAEGYFNRTLTLNDKNIILYMYDDLGLSFELIDYLFCRAVETEKTQLRYIEKVAISLHEKEIRTVNEAIQLFQNNSDIVHVVMHAFGLQSRQPTTAEQKYIVKWSDTFGFDKALIEEACSRSALNTNSGNFQYADKILTSWHESGVGSMADVEKLDKAHKEAASNKSVRKKAEAKHSNFHDFDQRGGNLEELEKKLVGSEDK